MAQCLDADQIDRDIARCTWHLLNGSQRRRYYSYSKKKDKIEGRGRNNVDVPADAPPLGICSGGENRKWLQIAQRTESLLRKKQRRLGNLINICLVQSYDNCNLNKDSDSGDDDEEEDNENDRRLRYYQGYHDVSCIFLNVLGGCSIAAGAPGNVNVNTNNQHAAAAALTASAMGLDLPSSVLLQVSRSHFRDYMRSNFQSLSAAIRLIMMPLIACLDRDVHAKLLEVDMEPYFAISWIISWFAHDVRDTALVKRLFDVFLVSHPLMPIYMR